MVTVEAKQFGRKSPAQTTSLSLPDQQTNLRQLLTQVVRAEVEAFHQRQQERSIFRVLTAQQIADGAGAGRIDPAPHAGQMVHIDDATTIALQAFEDGLFYAFVDGNQIEMLDTTFHLHTNSHLKLLRLVALAGG